MKSFTYTVNDPLGIHARPAGLIAKLAKGYTSVVTIEKDGKEAKATQLMKLMALAVKNGNTVTVKADGADEDAAIAELQKFFEENL